MESDQYANPILESKIDNLTGLVRWHEEDMKKWREQHINRHSGIFFGIGFGVIIVVLIALGVSGFHAIKNVEKATIGKIDKLQSLVSDTTVDNGAGAVFQKFIAEERPNMETRLAQLEADNKNLKKERETLKSDIDELRSELSGKAGLKIPSPVSVRRSHSANGSTARAGQ
jgi:tetrahydromethanopterin S-methyltransferase subunit G